MKILTVISNYNEEGAIERTIADFRANAGIKSDLLVIDNASTDQSLKLVQRQGVDYLQHPVNTGGSAGVIKTALLYADRYGYDIYCHLDGDNQHQASGLQKLIGPIVRGEADIVIGSRFIEKEGFQSLPLRKVGISAFSRLLSRVTGQAITDLTSGFRAYNRRAIQYFARQFQYELDPCVQMLVVASFAGLRIREVPVVMRPRLTGRSEINFKNAVKFPFFGLLSILGSSLQRRKMKEASDAVEL